MPVSTRKKTLAEEPVQAKTATAGPTWGRASKTDWVTVAVSGLIMLFCPFFVIYFWLVCDSYQCSLSAPVDQLLRGADFVTTLKSVLLQHFPKPTAEGFQIFSGWLVFQGLLYAFLPGKIGYGQRTPAGHILPYLVNGLLAWVLSHALFAVGVYLGYFKASVIHDNWGSLLVAANCYGFFLTAFAYLKAVYFPSHADDCKFSGSILYDVFMGVEFNPRFGKFWDFKLFHNGRPGILAWTLINASFAAAQYEKIGYITNSMVLVNLLHLSYVLDFFYNEDWYLRTVDIAHDHFGFYLAWGDSVWLPFMYTLQTHYLVRNPVDLPPWGVATVVAMGVFGYYIFRAVNYQKDIVRRSNGDCLIWGKPAKVIRAKYVTSDGKTHTSILIASGWWGLARHFNYTGDLVLSFAMCAACGTGHLLPWFYAIYMCILLGSRIRRDDSRCSQKYGEYWQEYKKAVRWHLIPGVF